MKLTSAGGVIALLSEPEEELKVFALSKLNEIVDIFWPEISEAVSTIERLHEDRNFKDRRLAALVASKIYYHLGAFEDSVTFALGAGDFFDVNSTSLYVETIIAKCIDLYATRRQAETEGSGDLIDPRLTAVVDLMFKRCLADKQFKQAVGLAIEARRIDIFERAIKESDDVPAMLSYAFRVSMNLIDNRQLRTNLLKSLVNLYLTLQVPDYISVCQCLMFLNDPLAAEGILEQLLKDKSTPDSTLMAYQIGFDLYDSGTQQFLTRVRHALRAAAPLPIDDSLPAAVSDSTDATPLVIPRRHGSSRTASDSEDFNIVAANSDEMVVDPPGHAGGGPSSASKEPMAPGETPDKERKLDDLSSDEADLQKRIINLDKILGGDITIDLHLQFLIRNNKADILILKQTKDTVRNSITHNATVIANGYMNCGTTSDSFLRENLDWLARANNWAKFTATATLGLIHMRHERDALKLMEAYLPKDSGSGSVYSEGGGLFALGLIHANHGGSITDYLLNQLSTTTSNMVRHGGCLGLGLVAMGTARRDIYDQLKACLMQDDAIGGEAAGLAMGLVMLGTKSTSAIFDMISYAQETQHEKILRGLAVGIALTMYGRLEEADELIERLCTDKDPIMRWAGMYTVALAYCGTGNKKAVRDLLHVAVSDVNDDVRRTAVLSLGFVLFRAPDQVPGLVSLLTESYNPHVRYGAAMALGIACGGTGLKEAVALLEPLMNDTVNYVRQGALIAMALVLVQQNEVTSPKVAAVRQQFSKIISDKHDDVMAKFGAIIAQGIIDAGGRNVTVSLQSGSGHKNMVAIVGMLIFQQFWYWFPMSLFLGLSFTPSALIGLNASLKMPRIEFKSSCKASMFAYPPPLEEKKDKNKEKVETVVLSITAKQKKRDEARRQTSKMDTETIDTTATNTTSKTKVVSGADKKTKISDVTGATDTMEVDDSRSSEAVTGAVTFSDSKSSVPSTVTTEVTAATASPTGSDVRKKVQEVDTKTEKKAGVGDKEMSDKEKADKSDSTTAAAADGTTRAGSKKDGGGGDKGKKASEPAFHMLNNPARVMPAQLKYISIAPANSNDYVALKEVTTGGVVMLKYVKDGGGEEALVEPVAAGGPQSAAEPEPPEPFEYPFDDDDDTKDDKKAKKETAGASNDKTKDNELKDKAGKDADETAKDEGGAEDVDAAGGSSINKDEKKSDKKDDGDDVGDMETPD